MVNLKCDINLACELYADKEKFSDIKENEADPVHGSNKPLTLLDHVEIIRNAISTCRFEKDKQDLVRAISPLKENLPSGWVHSLIDIARNFFKGRGLKTSRKIIENALATPFERQKQRSPEDVESMTRPTRQQGSEAEAIQDFLIENRETLKTINPMKAAGRDIGWQLSTLGQKGVPETNQKEALSHLKTKSLSAIKKELAYLLSDSFE